MLQLTCFHSRKKKKEKKVRPNEFQLQKKLESYTREAFAKCHAPSVEIEEEIKTSRRGELPEMEFV